MKYLFHTIILDQGLETRLMPSISKYIVGELMDFVVECRAELEGVIEELKVEIITNFKFFSNNTVLIRSEENFVVDRWEQLARIKS